MGDKKRVRHRKVDAGLVVALVVAERKVQPRLGTRKLHFMLKGILATEGVRLGRDLFFEVLREHELLLEPKPGAEIPARPPHHCLPVFTNLDQGSGSEQTQ